MSELPATDTVEVKCALRDRGAHSLRLTMIQDDEFMLLISADKKPICVLDRGGALELLEAFVDFIKKNPFREPRPAPQVANDPFRARLQREPTEPTRVGELVHQKRKLLNLTQSQLALKCGFSPGYVSLFETGRIKRPELPTLEKFARALDLDFTKMVKLVQDK